MSRKGVYLLHKGEPIMPLRHGDCAQKFFVVSVKMSKEKMIEIEREIEKAFADCFGVEKKPEKVWSVS